jgi:hypothetical protein
MGLVYISSATTTTENKYMKQGMFIWLTHTTLNQ